MFFKYCFQKELRTSSFVSYENLGRRLKTGDVTGESWNTITYWLAPKVLYI